MATLLFHSTENFIVTTPSSASTTDNSNQPRNVKTLPPLSALTYYRRNIWRTLPVGGAIVISVFLIASIVTLLNSVDRAITVNYGFTRHLSVVATQLIKEVPPNVKAKIFALPTIGQTMEAIPYVRSVKTVFGQMPIPVYGLDHKDLEVLTRATGNTLNTKEGGRWPKAGEPEIVLSRAWANNYGAKMGDKIEPLDDNLPSLTTSQTLVGILDGGENLALADKDYLLLELPEPVIRPSLLLLPRDSKNIDTMNVQVSEIIDNPEKHGLKKSELEYVKFYTFNYLVEQLKKTLGFLYQFLTIADILVIGAVALLSSFLTNIYFEQRLGEFGLLSAFGFRRERLARRVVIETGALVVFGWMLGMGLTVLGFRLLDAFYMAPRGLTIAEPGSLALIYTAPIPFLVGASSLGTVLTRLYGMDPIEIMERR